MITKSEWQTEMALYRQSSFALKQAAKVMRCPEDEVLASLHRLVDSIDKLKTETTCLRQTKL